jgi:hypothetical protein
MLSIKQTQEFNRAKPDYKNNKTQPHKETSMGEALKALQGKFGK